MRFFSRIELVEDWRDAWRWLSVNCMMLVLTVLGAWAAIPDDLKQHLPPLLVNGVCIGVLVLGVLGRLVKQKPRRRKQDVADRA